MKYVFDYTGNASNQKSAFMNDFINQFWKNVIFTEIDLRRHMVDINQALADAVYKNIEVIGATYTVDYSGRARLPVPEGYIQNRLASMVVDELVKCDKLPIRVYDSPRLRQKTYELTVPVIFLKPDQGEKDGYDQRNT